MRRRIWEGRAEFAQQFQTVALPVDDPEHDEPPCQFPQRTGKRRTIPCHPCLVARRRIDDHYSVSMRVADVHQLDPAIVLIRVDRRPFTLPTASYHHCVLSSI